MPDWHSWLPAKNANAGLTFSRAFRHLLKICLYHKGKFNTRSSCIWTCRVCSCPPRAEWTCRVSFHHELNGRAGCLSTTSRMNGAGCLSTTSRMNGAGCLSTTSRMNGAGCLSTTSRIDVQGVFPFSLNRFNEVSKNPSFLYWFKNVYLTFVKSAP